MRKKSQKKVGKVENFFLKPKPKPSHKRRNALIGIGTAAAILVGAGVSAKGSDQQ